MSSESQRLAWVVFGVWLSTLCILVMLRAPTDLIIAWATALLWGPLVAGVVLYVSAAALDIVRPRRR